MEKSVVELFAGVGGFRVGLNSVLNIDKHGHAIENSSFTFVWFTDGIGWNSAKHNLEETFDVLDNLYNLQDLESGAIPTLVDSTKYLNKLLSNK